MVMRCVFKHHVYLCVVSTALMAGLSLITSHTSKAYAKDQNCGSSGGGVVKTIQHNDQPIVCSSGETRILSSTRGGKEININMDTGPGEAAGAAVTVKDGANITILKKITVTGSGGKGSDQKPVIKVLNKGQLTLDEDVDVGGATGMQKAIVVDGSESSVTLKGKLTGFERVQVKNGGAVTLLKDGVKGIEGMKVKINDGGMVNMMGDVAFNSVGGAGIQITGDGAGKATVMGVGRTMTVNGSGSGIQMEGSGNADVMRLKIKGSGGTGVRVQNETGTMTLMGVEIEGFKMGVNAQSGTVKINGESTITVKDGGTGISMSGSGATVKMMEGKIMGSGGNFGVQMMGGTGTVELTSVGIEGVKKGVDMQAGTLDMIKGSINFTGGRGNYGVQVMGTGTANLTKVTITGEGSGKGEGKGVIMGSTGEMTMTNVNISKVKVGVDVTGGTLKMMGGTVTFTGGSGNYGVHVQNGVKMANLTDVTITGKGGQGTGVYVEGTGSASMMGGKISNVESGVYATGMGNFENGWDDDYV
ncbi:hypothetical protein [Bartonella bovis]|nr:hypothetical protein [Bartonella bovis]